MKPIPLPTATNIDTNDPYFIETVAVLLTGTAAVISTETETAHFIETVSAYLTGTAAALPTATSSQLPIVTQTATPQSPLEGRLYYEGFSDEQTGWEANGDGVSEFYYSDGQYIVEVLSDDSYYFMTSSRTFDDGVLSVDMTHLEGNDALTSGIVFWRYQDLDNFYALEVKGNGSYSIFRNLEGKFDLIKLLSNTPSLKTEETNKITIASHENNFDIYINDQFVYHFSDTSLSKGNVGLGAYPDLSSGVKIAFDNLTVYKYDLENDHTPLLPELTPTPSYRTASWAEISNFLNNDPTNLNTYDLNAYNCIDYAIDVVENAHLQGIKANIIAVDFVGQEDGHAFVEFDTSDAGVIYIEPQGDVQYYNVVVGNTLCDAWGEAECMGVIEAIHHLSECNHQHLCSTFPQ